MRVLIVLLALIAAPLVESVAQQRHGSRQSEARRGDDKKCQAAARAAAVRRDDRDDDDDGDRRSRERQARERRARDARRGRTSDRDDDGARRSSQSCDPAEPPPPPPADDPVVTTTEIRGVVFNDVNGNSMRDADEPGIANWLVMLTGDQGTVNLTTDAEGNFAFNGLALGYYILCQQQPGGAQSFPLAGTICSGAPGYEVTFVAPEVRSGMDFGNWMP